MNTMLCACPAGGGTLPPAPAASEAAGFCPVTLYLTVGPHGEIKMGTCAHCVLEERGRPARAWNANGDQDLDFDRDTLLAHLAELGITLTNREAYVCP